MTKMTKKKKSILIPARRVGIKRELLIDNDSKTHFQSEALSKIPRKTKSRRVINAFHAKTKRSVGASDSNLETTCNASKSPNGKISLSALEYYQVASRRIQSTKYPSELLVSLLEHLYENKSSKFLRDTIISYDYNLMHGESHQRSNLGLKLSLMDVGALDCPVIYHQKPQLFQTILSIDLNPQSKNVIRCDFFAYPVVPCCHKRVGRDYSKYLAALHDNVLDPLENDTRRLFDVISLSLVVNFLPSPESRGAMIEKAIHHLNPQGARLLYIVLPLACITNSRYCTRDHLISDIIEVGLGAKVLAERKSLKLYAVLLQISSSRCGCPCGCTSCSVHFNVDLNRHQNPSVEPNAPCICNGPLSSNCSRVSFKKSLIHDGRARNNFAIVI
jgi:hypothetical protein